jgi:tetratricopeptide (TPR) repeat protein
VYFDAERFDLAIPWYEQAVALDPKNVDASTDLGVCYYYANQIDRALAQLDHSLSIDPRHAKTLLNQGIVRAFGKNDLTGAAESWQRVVAIAPNSVEGKRAQQGLDGLKSGHSGTAAGSGKSGGL